MTTWVPTLGLATASSLSLFVGACSRTLPPPMMAFHGDTSAEPRGATSAMLVVGLAGPSFYDAYGLAIRVEHQDTTRRTIGVELSGGSDGVEWLLGVRGYMRHTPRSHDWVAATYGIGLSYLSPGLVTGSIHAGAAVSYVNDTAQPFLATGLALAVPLRQATRDWHPPVPCLDQIDPLKTILDAEDNPAGCIEEPREVPVFDTELFFVLEGGVAVPVGATGNQLSLDIGVARGLLGDNKVQQASIADRYTF